ncbi:MAG: NUDIX domain-containing protein [Acholeplasma sp.]|nr:NUDIX domain-containing protein [Acholeplasma sp.]
MKSIFCPHCGLKLTLKEIGDEGLVPFCLSCNKPVFDSSSICILTMVINEYDEVALLRQNYVSKEFLVFVAGYHKPNESAEQTVEREVFEELGQEVKKLKFIKTVFHQKLDTLFLLYVSVVQKKPFKLSAEVDEAHWYKLPLDESLLNEKGVALMLYRAYMNDET